ncbi:MAG: AtpZ/AtpI family protein [Rickettsiales bacterium]
MSQKTEKPAPSLDSLDKKLSALKGSQPDSSPEVAQGKMQSYRAASDFGAAALVGCGLGFGVDYVAHTSPFGLIIGLLVGVAAGFRMMMRTMNSSTSDKA